MFYHDPHNPYPLSRAQLDSKSTPLHLSLYAHGRERFYHNHRQMDPHSRTCLVIDSCGTPYCGICHKLSLTESAWQTLRSNGLATTTFTSIRFIGN